MEDIMICLNNIYSSARRYFKSTRAELSSAYEREMSGVG